MKSNLATLKFIRNAHSVELVITTLDNPEDKIYFYLLNDEIPLVLDCLSGQAKTFPYFNDCSQMMSFSPGGLHYIHLSSCLSEYKTEKAHGVYTEKTIALDGDWLNWWLGEFTIRTCETMEISQDSIDNMRFNCRSVSKFNYYDNVWTGNNYVLSNGQLKRHVINLCQSHDEFKHILSSLKRIANNSSNGNVVTIQISYDTSSERGKEYPNFYFTITNDKNERIMNGGIIAHNGKYQLHT